MNFHINPDETLVLDILLGITNHSEAEALKLKLMWGAKQMDNYRRIREYFNVDGQVITAVPRLLGGVASKKRKPTLANLKEQPDDHEAVKACFQVQAFRETAWLNSLCYEDLDAYLKDIEANKNFAPRVQMTVSKIREFKKLKEISDALNQRVIDVEYYEYYLTDLVETSLSEYPKGEWIGVVRNLWKTKGKNGGDDAEMK